MTQSHHTLQDIARARLKPVPEEVEKRWFEEAQAMSQAWLSIPPHPILVQTLEENPQTLPRQSNRSVLQGQFPWMQHRWLLVE